MWSNTKLYILFAFDRIKNGPHIITFIGYIDPFMLWSITYDAHTYRNPLMFITCAHTLNISTDCIATKWIFRKQYYCYYFLLNTIVVYRAMYNICILYENNNNSNIKYKFCLTRQSLYLPTYKYIPHVMWGSVLFHNWNFFYRPFQFIIIIKRTM